MMINDTWGLVLGILLLVIWVCIVVYSDTLRRAYTLGRTDKIQKRNRSVNYTGLACWMYRRGRSTEAKKHRLAVYSTRGLVVGDPAKARDVNIPR